MSRFSLITKTTLSIIELNIEICRLIGGFCVKLSTKSVDFARNHIKSYYDSDFYVKPFEFSGIWANWKEISDYITTTEIEDFKISNPIVLPSPKPKGGYRIVHQLDPISSIIYTALAYEVAEFVEKKRVDKSERIACSYRIEIDEANGAFFKDNNNGYKDFIQKSTELASKYKYALVTDIVDFYNQIYHHRLQNAIQSCDPSLDSLSKDIEKFISGLTNKVSRGIPVGPAASIIFSEALMLDIDEFVLSKIDNYTRYVDDMRFFSDDKDELRILLHDLTKYLYSVHRLVTADHKTEIIKSDDFISKYINNQKIKDRNKIKENISELNEKIFSEYASIEQDENEKLEQSKEKIEGYKKELEELMDKILSYSYLDLGLARHLLREAKKHRSRIILKKLLENFDFFTPVIRDVIIYLENVTNKKVVEHHISDFIKIINESKYLNHPYIKEWLGYFFASNNSFDKYREIYRFVCSTSIRNCAIFARTNNTISWVRSNKDSWSISNPWDKRGIIYSASVLSKDERNKWMDLIIQNGDLIDKSLAMYIKSL